MIKETIAIITSSHHKLQRPQSHNPTSHLPERTKQNSIKKINIFMEIVAPYFRI